MRVGESQQVALEPLDVINGHVVEITVRSGEDYQNLLLDRQRRELILLEYEGQALAPR